MREIVRCHRLEIPAGWDIVIHPKSSVGRAEFAGLAGDFVRLMKSV
jgi:RNase P protein component